MAEWPGRHIAERLIAGFAGSPLSRCPDLEPWHLTERADAVVRRLFDDLSSDYRIENAVAVHATARIEGGAVLKGPAIVGPNCLIAAGAYLRGGCWLGEGCVIGPGSELKSSYLFEAVKLAHFNFVGDSILGSRVNLEAGAIVANYRNEDAEPAIVLTYEGRRIATGLAKFGTIAGDGVKIGANAVIAPGTVLPGGTVVGRLALVDQR